MTKAPELLKLAERIGQATGPDREIDAAVARCFSNSVESDDGDFWWGSHDEPPQRVPAFTDSIDAAMTLVPEGIRRVEFGTYADGGCWAYVHTADDVVGNCGDAPTEAAAITAAALRARSAA